jgi:hypothetical protein
VTHSCSRNLAKPAFAALFGASLLFCAVVPARAQAPGSPQQQAPETWRMTVHPQPVARPALKHALLPDPADQTAGNAATAYLMASYEAIRVERKFVDPADLTRKKLPPAENDDLLGYYLEDVPAAQLPVEDVEQFLFNYRSALDLLDVATHRDHCRWDTAMREQGVAALLPHLNPSRLLANVAWLRVRLHIARKDYPAAANGVQDIFQLAHNLNDEAPLIQALVGTGIQALGTNGVRDLVQQPGAPNLYWPLANLPRPFMDLRSSVQWERAAVLAAMPELRRADTDPLTADEWTRLVTRAPALALGSRPQDDARSAGETFSAAAAGALLYPKAKQLLIDQGAAREQVDALPVPAVLGRYVLAMYEAQFDELIKWAGLPYPLAEPGMRRDFEAIVQQRSDAATALFLNVVPSVSTAATQMAKIDRRVAALQTVEAIRAYAATTDGKLPARLEDMTDTPAPTDPITGKPFAYRVEGADRATIEGAPPPSDVTPRGGLRIELTLAR